MSGRAIARGFYPCWGRAQLAPSGNQRGKEFFPIFSSGVSIFSIKPNTDALSHIQNEWTHQQNRSRSLISDTTIRTAIQPGSLYDAWGAEGLQGGIWAADNEQRRWDSLHILMCNLPDHRIAGHFRVWAVPLAWSSQFNPARLPPALCCIVAKI